MCLEIEGGQPKLDAHGRPKFIMVGSYEWADKDKFDQVVGRLGPY